MSTTLPDPSKPPDPHCPFCRSDRVVTTSKPVAASSYWRCQQCGQVWNPARHEAAPKRGGW